MLARVRKGNPCILLVGMYIGTDNGFLKKLKLDPPYDPVNTLQDISKNKTNKKKTTNSKRYRNPKVHGSIIYSNANNCKDKDAI